MPEPDQTTLLASNVPAQCCCPQTHGHRYLRREDATGIWWECYWCSDQQDSDRLPPCPSVYPPSADAPHEGTGWSGPLRCVLSDNGHEDHWHHGIHWQATASPAEPHVHCWHGQGHPDQSDPACCLCDGSGCPKASSVAPALEGSSTSETALTGQPIAGNAGSHRGSS